MDENSNRNALCCRDLKAKYCLGMTLSAIRKALKKKSAYGIWKISVEKQQYLSRTVTIEIEQVEKEKKQDCKI